MESAQAASNAAPPENRQKRRMVPIVDARFQWKYTLLIMALGVGVMALMGGFLYKAHTDNTRLLDLDGNAFLQEQVIRGDQIFLLYLLIAVIAMAILLAIWGLVVTHRISGPLFIVARYLGVLADGQYPDMRPLRKRDELQEFFGTFEDAVNSMKSRDQEALKAIDSAIEQANSGNAKAAVEVLQTQRNRLRQALGDSVGVE